MYNEKIIGEMYEEAKRNVQSAVEQSSSDLINACNTAKQVALQEVCHLHLIIELIFSAFNRIYLHFSVV